MAGTAWHGTAGTARRACMEDTWRSTRKRFMHASCTVWRGPQQHGKPTTCTQHHPSRARLIDDAWPAAVLIHLRRLPLVLEQRVLRVLLTTTGA